LIGHTLPESKMIGDNRYGYVCAILGDSLRDIVADEDCIADALRNHTFGWLDSIA
jgi:hypothetical protein